MDIITKYVDFSLNNLEVYTKMIMGKYFKKDTFKQYIEEYLQEYAGIKNFMDDM